MGHREALHDVGAGPRLRAVAFEEFQPRRGGGEEIADLDFCPRRIAARRELVFRALIDPDRKSVRRTFHARTNIERRDGANRRQGLAAKPKRRDLGEIACREVSRSHGARRQAPDLAAGMPLPLSMTRISRRPPDSIAISMRERARVERVFDELLDGGGRPLDDLARRDAIDKNGIETADGHGWFTEDVCQNSTAHIASDWSKARVQFPRESRLGRRKSTLGSGAARLIRNFPASLAYCPAQDGHAPEMLSSRRFRC